MLRVHFLQQWFTLSDPAVEEALYDVPLYRQFAGLDIGMDALPDESTILRFRHLLEWHGLAAHMFEAVHSILLERGLMLRAGTAVDATIIAAPSSTKNSTGMRAPEMHQTKKGNQWHFGMKAHIGVDADSGLVHTLTATPANTHDITEAHKLPHGRETDVLPTRATVACTRAKRSRMRTRVSGWHVAMMPGNRRRLDVVRDVDRLTDELEYVKARIRSKVEHPFRVIKRQFGHVKVRYRNFAKNTAQLNTLFALANLWMARKRLLRCVA